VSRNGICGRPLLALHASHQKFVSGNPPLLKMTVVRANVNVLIRGITHCRSLVTVIRIPNIKGGRFMKSEHNGCQSCRAVDASQYAGLR
jgi:hypothetical protein